MDFKKTLLTISLISALSGCGGGKKDTPKVDDNTGDTATPPTFSQGFSGTAAKGTLINGVVEVYRYSEGSFTQLGENELQDANIKTDENGQYNFTLTTKIDDPIKVEIVPSKDTNSPTYMLCDAPSGCGDVEYGAKVNLTEDAADFKLAALKVINNATTEVTEQTVHISSLSHLAFGVLQINNTITPENITSYNGKLANLFGLQGELTSLAPTSLDKLDQVASEDNPSELRLALINAGIANALYAQASHQDLDKRFLSAIVDIADENGAFLVTDDHDTDEKFELSVVGILDGAKLATEKLVTEIKSDPQLSSNATLVDELEQQATNLENEKAVQESKADESGRIVGQEPTVTDGTDIDKAMAMVDDVRVFANLFDVTKAHGQALKAEGSQFLSTLDSAGDMLKDEQNKFVLLSKVSQAIATIQSRIDEGELTGTEFELSDYIDIAGAQGKFIYDPENLTFSVNATAASEQVDAKFKVEINDDKTQYTLSISGLIANSKASFELTQNSQITLNLAAPFDLDDEDSNEPEFTSGELNLEVKIAQLATDSVTNPASFEGVLSSKLVTINVKNITYEDTDSINSYFLEDKTQLLPEMVTLSGAIGLADGDKITTVLTLNLNDLDNYQTPELKYFGKPVEDVAHIKIADNTLVVDSPKGDRQNLYNFETIDNQGWQFNRHGKSKDGNLSDFETTYKYWQNGPNRFYVYRIDYNSHDWFGGTVWKIVSVDVNGNPTTDDIAHYIVYIADGFLTDNMQIKNNDGSLIELENTLTSDGSWYPSLDDTKYLLYPAFENAEQVNSLSDLYPSVNDSVHVNNQGWAKFDKMAFIESAKTQTEFNLDAYIYDPDLSDTLTVNIANDRNTIELGLPNNTKQVFQMLDSQKPGHFTYQVSNNFAGELKLDHTIFSEATEEQGQSKAMVTTKIRYVNSHFNWHKDVIFTAVDNNSDGITDGYNISAAEAPLVNSDNQLMYENGQVLNESDYLEFGFYEDPNDFFVQNNSPFQHYIAFNPIAVETALDAIKSQLAINASYQIFIPGLGEVFKQFSASQYNAWDAGTAETYDMYLLAPDLSVVAIENEDAFIDANAALNVALTIGEYDIELDLAAERTAYKEGKLALDVAYSLPKAEKTRSFNINYDTELGIVDASNGENVKVEFIHSDESNDDAQQVLATIKVADKQVGEIVRRDNLVVIVYSDGRVESL